MGISIGGSKAAATSVVKYIPRDSMTGPATTDITSVTPGNPSDAAFNESYVLGSTSIPSPWPVDVYGWYGTISGSTLSTKTSQTSVACSSTYRVMCDGSEFIFFGYANNFTMDIFIDGKPYANNPVTQAISTGYSPYGFTKIIFTSAKPRLIEIRTSGGIVGVYTKKPYRCWKPSPDTNPKVAVVGDSFVLPSVMNNAASGALAVGSYELGLWQRMPALLGITSLVTDGIGGTGYIAGGGSNLPYSHSSRKAWVQNNAPDVLVYHGGGCNDIYAAAATDAQIIAAAVAQLTWARSVLPNAKLVFVEGFSPPGFTPSVYNPRFVTIRQGVQNALATMKSLYFLDIATTRPPLAGTGYVTAPDNTNLPNTNIYIGSDSFHPTQLGHQYLRHVVATKMRRVLADDGSLSGQLIL